MIKNLPSKFLAKLDILGTIISAACAVHCLILPALLLSLPFFGLAFMLEESFELMLLIAALALALTSFFWGFKTHGETYVFYFLLSALFLFFFSRLESLENLERFLVAGGGVCLVIGHLINRKLCNTCPTCHHCDCSKGAGTDVPSK